MKNKLHFNKIYKWTGVILCVFLSGHTFALVPFVDSGKLLRKGKNEISLHTQLISGTKGIDINVIGQFDEGFSHRKDMNIRYFLGIGESGGIIGSHLKWVPFPDYKYQPALGTSVGMSYNYFNKNTHYISLYLRPLISKEFGTVVGKFIPYLAFPSSIRIKNFSKVQFPLRFTVGIRGELFFIHFHKFELNLEFSTDLTKNTASYFVIGIITQWI